MIIIWAYIFACVCSIKIRKCYCYEISRFSSTTQIVTIWRHKGHLYRIKVHHCVDINILVYLYIHTGEPYWRYTSIWTYTSWYIYVHVQILVYHIEGIPLCGNIHSSIYKYICTLTGIPYWRYTIIWTYSNRVIYVQNIGPPYIFMSIQLIYLVLSRESLGERHSGLQQRNG